jgi:transposase
MPKLLRARELAEDERVEVRRLAHSRTEAARLVERARIVWLSAEGRRVAASAAEVGCHERTVRLWLTRFNAGGVAGLRDQPRPGCPATYTPEQIGAVVAAALSDPQERDRPFGAWTYDRLEA